MPEKRLGAISVRSAATLRNDTEDCPLLFELPKASLSSVYKMEIAFSHGKATLNQEQAVVVTADAYQNQRILASAGSGKTTTITARISYLIERYGVDPSQIVLVTFSRNAAREMVGRVRALCGPVAVWAGTFHGLAKKILTDYDYASIRDPFFIDELPVRLTAWMRTPKGRKWVGSLRYVIVDEFQDINHIQWRLLETMRHPGVRFIIVGDDAQNIYTWRGSSAKYLLDYASYVKSVVDYQLRMNYRSSEAIVNVANRVMLKIPTLDWKQTMIPAKKGGIKPEVVFFWRLADESHWVAKQLLEFRKKQPTLSLAVLARNNVDLYRVEEALLQAGLRCRFLSTETVDGAEEVQHRGGVVDLSTFHGSKGLEWDVTFCICLSDDRLPGRKQKDAIIHERRLFYVGITRARQRLFLSYHGNERHLTRFVREIGYSYLQFHGLAKYALSDVELGEQQPSLQSILECLDGDDWQIVREQGDLPFEECANVREISYLPLEDIWKSPSWADPKTFQHFLHMVLQRCILQQFGWPTDYQDPFLERLIFRIRIFAEDAEFWRTWEAELNEMVREFFADSARIPPCGYPEIAGWVHAKGIPWGQQECITATSILAKIRGQLRPLRFDTYSLDEFTICPTRVVVPTESRSAVLRSWRKYTDKTVGWKDCLLDCWRLAALYQVAEGRNAVLLRVQEVGAQLQDCIPYLERMESVLPFWLAGKQNLLLNPECIYEDLSPIHCDCILDSTLCISTGDARPDLSTWTEALLKAYCFIQSGTAVESIQLMNPFRGSVYTLSPIPLAKIHTLYKRILSFWKKKQGV